MPAPNTIKASREIYKGISVLCSWLSINSTVIPNVPTDFLILSSVSSKYEYMTDEIVLNIQNYSSDTEG